MGPGHQAHFVYTEDLDIPLDADLTAAFACEIERNREIAAQSDTVAAAVGERPPAETSRCVPPGERSGGQHW